VIHAADIIQVAIEFIPRIIVQHAQSIDFLQGVHECGPELLKFA
jgi:hypothetical protein